MNYNILNNDKMDVARAVSGVVITKQITSGTLDYNICQKIGKIVIASARIHSINPAITSTQNWFKIAEGYRPTTTVYGIGSMAIETISGSQALLCEVKVTGDVYLGWSASIKASAVSFFAVYYIN